MNLPIYEGFFFLLFFLAADRVACFCGFWEPLQLWTPLYDGNVRAVKHSATCHLFFMHLFPYLSGLTGCGCLGIIIIISGRLFELKLEPWRCTPDSSHFQDSSLFKREGQKGGGWNRRLSRGLFITEISSTCTLYTFFFKGASITMPNLVNVLIKGLLYCFSLHNCVRSWWE